MIGPVLSQATTGGNGNSALADGRYAIVGMAIRLGKFKRIENGVTKTDERKFYVPVLATLDSDNKIVGVTTCYKSDFHHLRVKRIDLDNPTVPRDNSGDVVDGIQKLYDRDPSAYEDNCWFNTIIPGMFGRPFTIKVAFFTSRTKNGKLWTNHVYHVEKSGDFNPVVIKDTATKNMISDFLKSFKCEAFGSDYLFGFGGEEVTLQAQPAQAPAQAPAQPAPQTPASDNVPF